MSAVIRSVQSGSYIRAISLNIICVDLLNRFGITWVISLERSWDQRVRNHFSTLESHSRVAACGIVPFWELYVTISLGNNSGGRDLALRICTSTFWTVNQQQ
jgi:hypothetical protein